MTEKNISRYRTFTFRPTAEVEKLLDTVTEAVGIKRSEIINDCLRTYLPKIIQAKIDERVNALEDYFDSMDTEERLEKHMAKKGKKVGKRSRVDVDALKLAQHAANEVKKKRKKG